MPETGKRWIGGLLLWVAATGWAATYKWIDNQGGIHYSDRFPPGAGTVELLPPTPTPAGAGDCTSFRCRVQRFEAQYQEPSEKGVGGTDQNAGLPAAPGVRGLPFEIYIRLRRGMTEGEVLARAGSPDVESVQGVETTAQRLTGVARQPGTGSTLAIVMKRSEIVKTYTYLPTLSDPFTTVITFKGGRVSDIQRIKKF